MKPQTRALNLYEGLISACQKAKLPLKLLCTTNQICSLSGKKPEMSTMGNPWGKQKERKEKNASRHVCMYVCRYVCMYIVHFDAD
jgi:hypothetical protein